MTQKTPNHVPVLIIGAGPAGLSAALTLKKARPDLDVVVIDKAAGPGRHNLSGAVLEPGALARLLDPVLPDWKDGERAKRVFVDTVRRDDLMFFLGDKYAFKILPAVKIAKSLGLGFGQLAHTGDLICSVSKLTAWLHEIALSLGVEVMHGFAAGDILWDEGAHAAKGVKLVDQGLDREGRPQPNYLPGETITADAILIAEGCDGLVAEKFIAQAGLIRQGRQLYSLGVKELIKVSGEQYQKYGADRVVHALGYPLWTPLRGPDMFGGGIMYPMGDNYIVVGMIVGLDYKYGDFNPQDALTLFKEHRWVKPFIEGGSVVEAGAKMIPEGGCRALPRCPETGTIGRSNVCLLGDSAGLVNMLKIKGLHNAILSGIAAAEAVAANLDAPLGIARAYTRLLGEAGVEKEMASARNFRQTVARCGPLVGMPLSVLGGLLPPFDIEPDWKAMTPRQYRLKPAVKYDKDTFTALARTEHREEQPSHLTILDGRVCVEQCDPKFGRPCITFCPAGVYEAVQGETKPANPSNCVHCKTCQRKCPFDNIRWTCPEPGGGPKYQTM
jgi:electron-transferring-flavoprotein dehydrogenase